MKRNAMNVVLGLVMVALFFLPGCGGGGGPAAVLPANGTTNSHITSIVWIFNNAAPDFFNNGPTCFMTAQVYYDESIAAADIEYIGVTAPNGWKWKIPANDNQLGTDNSGKSYVIGNISGNIAEGYMNIMPLAGTWIFQLKLKNGETSSVTRTLHEPGSVAAATHKYIFTGEDWSPSTKASQYIASLGRFPAQGYTLQYVAGNGGLITTKGFSAVRNSFFAAEPHAYNMACWLFDANKDYLGVSIAEFSQQDHSRTSLVDNNGELMIRPAFTASSTGEVDLSAVRYIRFVYLDGAQYEPKSYSNADYRSISSLVAVSGIKGSTDNIAPKVTPPDATTNKGPSRQSAAAGTYADGTALDMATLPGIPGTPYLATP